MSFKPRISWIEVLIWIAILGIIASFVLRIIYGQQTREVEAKVFARFGIGNELQLVIRICIGFVAVALLVYRSRKSKRS